MSRLKRLTLRLLLLLLLFLLLLARKMGERRQLAAAFSVTAVFSRLRGRAGNTLEKLQATRRRRSTRVWGRRRRGWAVVLSNASNISRRGVSSAASRIYAASPRTNSGAVCVEAFAARAVCVFVEGLFTVLLVSCLLPLSTFVQASSEALARQAPQTGKRRSSRPSWCCVSAQRRYR